MSGTGKTLFSLCAALIFSLARAELKGRCPSGFTFIGEKCYHVSYEKVSPFPILKNTSNTLLTFRPTGSMPIASATI